MDLLKADIARVRRRVWTHYRAQGRHELPWRHTNDPYKILVSEVMLQQTQVSRVVQKYHAFIRCFPTIHALSETSLSEVLTLWQGLGYNRRAKMLHEAARMITTQHNGSMPHSFTVLRTLPGVGVYTAGAVCAFAYNQHVPMVETNIRTVLMHHLLPGQTNVADEVLLQIAAVLCPRGRAREWYWALMDYGAHLKEQGIRLNYASKHYSKQSIFEGSDRQLRGAIVRVLAGGSSVNKGTLVRRVQSDIKNAAPERVRAQLARLTQEGLVTKVGGRYMT